MIGNVQCKLKIKLYKPKYVLIIEWINLIENLPMLCKTIFEAVTEAFWKGNTTRNIKFIEA